jgi:biopolymer transport protein ExbD
MADVQTAEPKKKKGGGIPRRHRVAIRIDMTPMVDVAFLLLIFFMVTTVFRKPLAMEVNMPDLDAKVQVPMGNVMTMYVLEDGSLEYEIGQMGLNSVPWNELTETFLAELDLNPELIVLVKTSRESRFENMVDMLDALDRAHMQRFSVVDMTPEDEERIGGGL